MSMRSKHQPQNPRSETSGAGVVTVLVLLLLMGGVDGRTAEAFRRAATGLVHEEVVGSPAPGIVASVRRHPVVPSPRLRIVTARGERPAMATAAAMLPEPRAPDHDRVV